MPDENQVQNLINIESLINTANSRIEELTRQLKEQKGMIDELLLNDSQYQQVDEATKKQAKIKNSARQNILNSVEAKPVDAAIVAGIDVNTGIVHGR